MTEHIPTPDCLTGNCPVCNFESGIGRREAVHGELMTGEEDLPTNKEKDIDDSNQNQKQARIQAA